MARSGIAIVGMSGGFTGCGSVEEFWSNLKSGVESVGKDARFDAGAAEAGMGHWVESASTDDRDEWFDAGLFGLSPREAARMEPQHRLFLEGAWEAMEDGGCSTDLIGPRVGVFGGANFTSYFQLTPDSHLPDALDEMIGSDKDYLATRVAHHLGLQGPAMTVQSACSTSLVAVHLACQSLRANECDAALAGGVSITRPRLARYFYTPGGILSPDGYCRAFDADALGTVFTEGAGVVALMRLDDALANRHPIYAVIRGSSVNNDGGGKTSYMAPSIAGQERVIRDAFKAAKVEPENISYIEAHGTATVLGDAIELAALTRVFRGQTDKVGFCQLGSVKGNIGHTVSAAGVAGLMKTALALKHELIPPNVNFSKPNPDLDLMTSPFFVSAEPREWPRQKNAARMAGVSSFGVGGTNAHVVLQEPPRQRRANARRSHYVLNISAASDAALAARASQLRDRLKGASRRDLADVAYTLNVGRPPLGHRAGVVCRNVREAREALAGLVRAGTGSGRVATGKRAIAFMFPGQGSQYVGMGRQLYEVETAFREVVDTCLAHLRKAHQLDLAPAFQAGAHGQAFDEASITRTEFAQPLIFIVEYALGALLISWSVKPSYAMGHSVGEFAAAALAGVFRLEDALDLVVLRGQLMQAMAPGAMLSIAATREAVESLLPPGLDIAAVNSPRQCVVSGPSDLIDQFDAELAKLQMYRLRLQTSHAFHSRMMEPMLEAFRNAVSAVETQVPTFPIISNETGGVAPWDALRDPDYWVRHIRQPVMFAEGLETLASRGVDLLVEVGPGRQLAGLAQQNGLHRQGVRIVSAMHSEGGVIAEESILMRGLLKVWLEGAVVDWKALHRHEHRQMVSMPRYPFEREKYPAMATTTKPAPRKGKLDVADWLYLPTWRRMVLRPTASQLGKDECWVVFENEGGLAVAERLAARGQRAVVVRVGSSYSRTHDDFTVNPEAVEDYKAVLNALKADGLAPRRIVHAWSLDRAPSSDWGQTLGLRSLARLLNAHHEVLGREPVAVDIVVSGAHEVTGVESLRPEAASAVAFAKVAPQENVQLSCRVIDLDPDLVDRPSSTTTSERLVEALVSGSDKGIALRGAHWWEQGFEPCPIAADRTAASRLREGGVYLITGGLGHIGMIFARHLAKTCNARLILVGRSPLEPVDAGPTDPGDPPTRRDRLAELNALGGEAIYLQADVSMLEDMQNLRALVYEWFGRLDGMIFGAGSVEAQAAADDVETFEIYDENYVGKVLGLKNALTVFGDDPLDFALVLSSISTLLGGMGLSSYAAANHVADLLVLQHRRSGHPEWMTTNWDLWAGGKISEVNPKLGRFLGLAIHPHEGAEVLDDLLRLPQLAQVIVSTYLLEPRIDTWIRGLIDIESVPATQHKRPNLAAEYVEAEGEFEQRLAKLWSQVLGIETIGRDDDFFEMGGHSLLAVQIAVKIQEFVPPEAPGANLYETPTIRSLAAALEARPGADAGHTRVPEAVS